MEYRSSGFAEPQGSAALKEMTLEEKITYFGGYNDFYIRAIPRLGIPNINLRGSVTITQ